MPRMLTKKKIEEKISLEHHPQFLENKADIQTTVEQLALMNVDLSALLTKLDDDLLMDVVVFGYESATMGNKVKRAEKELAGMYDTDAEGKHTPNAKTSQFSEYHRLKTDLNSVLNLLEKHYTASYGDLVQKIRGEYAAAMKASFERPYVLGREEKL
jgi:hypothetical protein